MVEIRNDAIKEDEKAVLLEGGSMQPMSSRARIETLTHHVSRFGSDFLLNESVFPHKVVYMYYILMETDELSSNMPRFLLMDETFLLDNRLTLRAM